MRTVLLSLRPVTSVSCAAMRCFALLLGGVGLLAPLSAAYAQATGHQATGQQVVVELTTGRQVRGELSDRSNGEYLWISTTAPGISLESGFPLSKVVRWQVADGRAVTSLPAPVTSEIDTNGAGTNVTASSPAVSIERQTVRHVASLEIFARVANWDADAEVDGIEVLLRPLDSRGQLVSFRGQVHFKLLGQRQPEKLGSIYSEFTFQEEADYRFVELTQWTRRLQQTLSTDEGTILRLEFRNFHPDRDLAVDVESILQARLSVAGQGVYEAVSPPLFLRSYSRLRDDLQQQTGSRHFTQERFHP